MVNHEPAQKKVKTGTEENGNSSASFKVVILVGGPSKGTRFRPLSLEVPKPLFPVAGKPLIWHHIKACSAVSKEANLIEVLLVGFYDGETPEWKNFISATEKELGFKIRYLREQGRLGTAGGINSFRSEILSGNPDYFFVLHCDVVCTFPLHDILQFHRKHGKACTILGKKVRPDEAHHYGCLAVDPNTNEVLHYAEKPETFVSDIINCGVYLFSAQSIFGLIDKVSSHIRREVDQDPHFLQMEQDLFMRICGDKEIHMFETKDFWVQLKAAGMVVKCAEHLLNLARTTRPDLLAKSGDGKTSPTIIGNVMIDPSAKVHPSAKLGPNVSIGANAVIGQGVRISHSIILDGAEVKDHACILFSVIGWQCVVGRWSRLEGVPDFTKAMDDRSCGITILGTGVTAAPEIVVRASIVLPHKELGGNHNNQILL